MTPAVLLAVCAAAVAAGAIVELAALAGERAAARAARAAHAGATAGAGGASGAAGARLPGLGAGGRLLAAVGRAVGALAPPADLDARLAAAGAEGRIGAGDLMALKGGAAAAALLLAPAPAAAAPGRLGVVVLVALPAAAYLAPDAWLRRRARARGRRLTWELADVLELLLIAADAGLPPQRAAAEVGRRRGGLLAAELRRATARAALGVPWLEAVDELERRCPAEGVPALAAALRRAHRHGTPVGPVLAALAADARARRAAAVREHAARAAPKIQLVVALLLVPAVLLLLAAALAPALL